MVSSPCRCSSSAWARRRRGRSALRSRAASTFIRGRSMTASSPCWAKCPERRCGRSRTRSPAASADSPPFRPGAQLSFPLLRNNKVAMTNIKRLHPTVWLVALATAVLACAGSASAQVRSGFLPDFTELYERQSPAVVSIDVTQKARRGRVAELSEDDPFYEFFRRFGQVPRRGLPEREPEAQAVGSGFLISSDGYLITNAHVVEGADEVKVNMSDRREFRAKVVGADKRTDIALLKI